MPYRLESMINRQRVRLLEKGQPRSFGLGFPWPTRPDETDQGQAEQSWNRSPDQSIGSRLSLLFIPLHTRVRQNSKQERNKESIPWDLQIEIEKGMYHQGYDSETCPDH